MDYEENLVPPNAPDAEQEQEQEEDHDESENTDNNEDIDEDSAEPGNKVAEMWEKDEEDLEIQNESNQKVHYKDGDMVEDIDYRIRKSK